MPILHLCWAISRRGLYRHCSGHNIERILAKKEQLLYIGCDGCPFFRFVYNRCMEKENSEYVSLEEASKISGFSVPSMRKAASAGRVRSRLASHSRPKWRIFLILREDAEIIGKRGFILTKAPQSEFSPLPGSKYAYAIGKLGYFQVEVPPNNTDLK